MTFGRCFVLGSMISLCLSCAGFLGEPSKVYDSRKIKIEMLSLFNQRANPKNTSKTWRGDWLFRRERLSVIDKEFGDLKPDLIIFQEMMQRHANPYESDQGILSAGALKGFKWKASNYLEYSDTGEEEFLAVALSSPLDFSETELTIPSRFGSSVLAIDTLLLEKQKFLVVNMKLEDSISESELENLANEIEKKMETEKVCSHRLLIATYAASEIYEKVTKISEIFGLKDAAKGFCITEESCYTATAHNQIFRLAYGGILPSRVDFLLVPVSARVSLSEINFKEPKQTNIGFFKQFGLNALWPSDRFGLRTELNLAKCDVL